jgi:hypothetical protein
MRATCEYWYSRIYIARLVYANISVLKALGDFVCMYPLIDSALRACQRSLWIVINP